MSKFEIGSKVRRKDNPQATAMDVIRILAKRRVPGMGLRDLFKFSVLYRSLTKRQRDSIVPEDEDEKYYRLFPDAKEGDLICTWRDSEKNEDLTECYSPDQLEPAE